ncbi:MAG: thiamine phosphate synthase [Alsobacter sp.]
MTESARLVLATPRPLGGQRGFQPAAWADDLARSLGAAFEGGPVDAVLLSLPGLDERSLVKLLKPIVALGQEKGAAMLLVDAPDIVARAGADGVHVSRPEALQGALDMLKPHDRIVGVGGVRARHDAMEAAEAGADYVLFGEPDEDGQCPPLPAVLERAAWWAEVFQTPCVAYAPGLGDVAAMAATGCEFVALGEAAFGHAEGPAAAIRSALAAISAAPAPLR